MELSNGGKHLRNCLHKPSAPVDPFFRSVIFSNTNSVRVPRVVKSSAVKSASSIWIWNVSSIPATRVRVSTELSPMPRPKRGVFELAVDSMAGSISRSEIRIRMIFRSTSKGNSFPYSKRVLIARYIRDACSFFKIPGSRGQGVGSSS